MFAADTNIWIIYFSGEQSSEMTFFHEGVLSGKVLIPPAVISEFLSDPELDQGILSEFLSVNILSSDHEYWKRAGLLRAEMFGRGFKPKLPDTLIAQSCIDHDVPLLTRDAGFEMFAEHGGLQLVETGA